MGMLCEIFGHNWRYNFVSIANKRICIRCKKREALNTENLKWNKKFVDERTDEELIKIWHR